jgi:hypothetical protein
MLNADETAIKTGSANPRAGWPTGNLKHMVATPYVDLIQRPNGECPQSKLEQGILNKLPGSTIMVTFS